MPEIFDASKSKHEKKLKRIRPSLIRLPNLNIICPMKEKLRKREKVSRRKKKVIEVLRTIPKSCATKSRRPTRFTPLPPNRWKYFLILKKKASRSFYSCASIQLLKLSGLLLRPSFPSCRPYSRVLACLGFCPVVFSSPP